MIVIMQYETYPMRVSLRGRMLAVLEGDYYVHPLLPKSNESYHLIL